MSAGQLNNERDTRLMLLPLTTFACLSLTHASCSIPETLCMDPQGCPMLCTPCKTVSPPASKYLDTPTHMIPFVLESAMLVLLELATADQSVSA